MPGYHLRRQFLIIYQPTLTISWGDDQLEWFLPISWGADQLEWFLPISQLSDKAGLRSSLVTFKRWTNKRRVDSCLFVNRTRIYMLYMVAVYMCFPKQNNEMHGFLGNLGTTTYLIRFHMSFSVLNCNLNAFWSYILLLHSVNQFFCVEVMLFLNTISSDYFYYKQKKIIHWLKFYGLCGEMCLKITKYRFRIEKS